MPSSLPVPVPLPLPLPLPLPSPAVVESVQLPDSRSQTHLANSSSLAGSDFEFDPRLSDADDPPLSPKIFSPFPIDHSIPAFPDVPQQLVWPPPTRSPPAFSVRQLMAVDLSDEASSVASSPRLPPSSKVQEPQVAIAGQNLDVRKEQKGMSVSDRRTIHLSPLTLTIHHSDEDPTEGSDPVSRDSFSVDEETPISKAGRADQAMKSNRKKWTLKDFLCRSKGDHRTTIPQQITKRSPQRSPQMSPHRSSQGHTSPIPSAQSSPQRSSPASPARTLSPHELHYKVQKAHAEELRKKTFLPYRQGLLGCLGGAVVANTSDFRPVQQQVW